MNEIMLYFGDIEQNLTITIFNQRNIEQNVQSLFSVSWLQNLIDKRINKMILKNLILLSNEANVIWMEIILSQSIKTNLSIIKHYNR